MTNPSNLINVRVGQQNAVKVLTSAGGPIGPTGVQGTRGTQGLQGTQGLTGSTGGNAGRIFYFAKQSSDINGYYKALESPSTSGLSSTTVQLTQVGVPVLIDKFVTEPNSPGVLSIPVGENVITIHTKVNRSLSILSVQYNCIILKCNSDGTGITTITSSLSEQFSSTNLQEFIWNVTTQNAVTVNITDRIIFELYVIGTDTGSIEVDYEDQVQGFIRTSISAGAIGPQGVQGVQGQLNNFQGTNGAQGLQGTQGLQGLQGVQGKLGSQGSQGTQGVQNAQGLQGTQSAQGLQGVQGTQGVQNAQGLQGTQSAQGLQGSQGTQNAQGLQGTQGTQGLQGVQGSGYQGTQGVQNAQGLQGTQGLTGPVAGSNAQVLFNNNNVSAGATNFVYDATNVRVGIGTTTPTTKLAVVGDGYFTGVVTATSFSGSGANLTGINAGVGIATAGGTVGTGATILDFRGSGISTVTVASGIATINITGGTATSGTNLGLVVASTYNMFLP
jgi:hypothetical protein